MSASTNATLTTLKSASPEELKKEVQMMKLRLLYKDSDLPEVADKESIFRHHPKYLNKIHDDGIASLMGQSFASFAMTAESKKDGEGSGNSSSSSSPSLASLQGNPEALKAMMSEFMNKVISSELVASN